MRPRRRGLNFNILVSFYREYNCLSNDILWDDLALYLQGQGQFTWPWPLTQFFEKYLILDFHENLGRCLSWSVKDLCKILFWRMNYSLWKMVKDCVIQDEPQSLQKLSLLLGTWLKFKEIVFPFNHPRIKLDWLRSVSSTYFRKLIPGQLDFPQGDFQEYCFWVEFSPGGFPRVLFLGVYKARVLMFVNSVNG